MYSGDEYYGDDITSPTERPLYYRLPALTEAATAFDAWITKLDKIVWKRVGCSLDDLEDFDTESGFEDGLTPAQFYAEYIAPEVGEG